MKLITYYIVISLIGDVAAVALCLAIEQVVPWASMPIFLTLFFLILWVAWVLAVKMTEPKTEIRTGRCNERPAGLNPPSLSGSLERMGKPVHSRLPLRLSGMIDLLRSLPYSGTGFGPRKSNTNRRTHVGARLEQISH